MSLTPYKVCSFDCIYCQLGKTTQRTALRKEYVNTDEALTEIKNWLNANPAEAKKLDYITFSGAGEPTLNINIGKLISGIKEISAVPVAILTNSSHLSDPQVRKAIEAADLIVPSLDAAEQDVFERIDAPEKGIKVAQIIDGLAALRKEFRGKIWLEIMLLKGVNDSPGHIAKLKEALNRIKADKVQLNSPVRKTLLQDIYAVEAARLKEIAAILGDNTELC